MSMRMRMSQSQQVHVQVYWFVSPSKWKALSIKEYASELFVTLSHILPLGGYVDHPVQHGCGRLQTDATHGQGPWKYLELLLIYIQTEQSHDDMKCSFLLVFEAAKSVNICKWKPWAPIQMLHPTSQRLWTHVNIFSDTRRQQSCVLCTSPKWISWGSQCGGVPTAVMKVTSAEWPLHASLWMYWWNWKV